MRGLGEINLGLERESFHFLPFPKRTNPKCGCSPIHCSVKAALGQEAWVWKWENLDLRVRELTRPRDRGEEKVKAGTHQSLSAMSCQTEC